MMVETDCPWCEIRPTHAGHKLIKTKVHWLAGWLMKNWLEKIAQFSLEPPISAISWRRLDSFKIIKIFSV
jgi:Tat protein secretion system quality control protein TatD with DNase activity